MTSGMTVKRAVWDDRHARDLAREASDGGAQAAAEEVLERAEPITPRDKGDLAGSADVSLRDGVATVSYSSKYAVVQHEHPEYKHQGSGQSKWLERTLNDGHKQTLEVMADAAKEKF